METLYPIIFNQVRDLTSSQFTHTHILISYTYINITFCIECWGGDPGNVHNNNIHTAPDNFEFTESSTLDRTFLYITKTDGKET